MRTPRWTPGLILLMVLLLAGSALAGLLLCPRCGHEVASDVTVCAHCQNMLAAAPDAPAPAPRRLAEGALVDLPRSVLETELATARADIEQDHPVAAWLRARLLAGLLALNPEAAALETARAGVERQAQEALREREQACPVCRGTGVKTVLFAGVSGAPTQQKTAGKNCPACQGTGQWKAQPTQEQVEVLFAEAQRTLTAALRERGWLSTGGLWLLPGLTNLTVRQTAAARKAVAGPCESCRGWGRAGCETCRGAGRLVCTQTGCVAGQMICPDCQGTRRMQVEDDGRTITRRCTSCRQTGVIECPTCRGLAYLPCTECESRGETTCGTCKGTGEKALCRSCGGEGLRVCKRCQGSGTYRSAPCLTCQGQGVELCSSCQGRGRGKR